MKAPIWISHRGLGEDENTFGSFQRAVEGGFDVLETDLRVSADGHLLLHHDLKVQGYDIRSTSRKILDTLRLKNGGSLLFWEEFAQSFSQLPWVLDIKPHQGMEVLKILKKWSEKKKSYKEQLSRGYFLFWNKDQQAFLKNWLPQAKCFAREWACRRAAFSLRLGLPQFSGLKSLAYALPCTWILGSLCSKSLVEDYHKREAQVIGYLPKNLEEIEIFLESKVDFILSDLPISRKSLS